MENSLHENRFFNSLFSRMDAVQQAKRIERNLGSYWRKPPPFLDINKAEVMLYF